MFFCISREFDTHNLKGLDKIKFVLKKEALLSPPHPPQMEVLVALWATWKTVCSAMHSKEDKTGVDLNVQWRTEESRGGGVEREGERALGWSCWRTHGGMGILSGLFLRHSSCE